MAALRLGVNVDHVATVRNARGGAVPDPVRAALLAIEAGADGITAHLREDRRHIHDDDMRRLKAAISKPLNFEMAATGQMLDIALRIRPHACCLVPEKRTERTTEGGLDVDRRPRSAQALRRRTEAARGSASRCSSSRRSTRSTPAPRCARPSSSCTPAPGATRSRRARRERADYEFGRLRVAAAQAAALGLECHAGHGLDYDTARAIAGLPEIVELNIGHFLVGEAIFVGLAQSVRTMRAAMDEGARARRRRPMIVGIGSDLCDIRRIEETLERFGERFLARCFTEVERRQLGAPGRARRLLRQALRRQGGLRQGAGHRAARRACSGATWASSTCPRASRRCF